MNKSQKAILIVAAAAVLLMMLFPPFHIIGQGGIDVGRGYSFLLDRPHARAAVDVAQLIAQWIGVLLIAALLYFVVRSEK